MHFKAKFITCPQTGGHGRELERENNTKKCREIRFGDINKFHLDILIAHILNYFCCDLKGCMQFLSDDDYQLNNTVRDLRCYPSYIHKQGTFKMNFFFIY